MLQYRIFQSRLLTVCKRRPSEGTSFLEQSVSVGMFRQIITDEQ